MTPTTEQLRGHLPNGLCYWCGRQMMPRRRGHHPKSDLTATKDHIEPRCNGGTVMIWACNACNGQKADLSLDDWRAFMELYPQWWKLFDTPKARGKTYAKFKRLIALAITTERKDNGPNHL